MIRRADEYSVEQRPCGGSANDFEVRQFYSKDELFGLARLFCEIVFKPHDLIPLHAHENEAEIFHVLEGELVAIDENGVETPFKQGDYMVTGGGEKHSLRNDTEKTARIMAVIIV